MMLLITSKPKLNIYGCVASTGSLILLLLLLSLYGKGRKTLTCVIIASKYHHPFLAKQKNKQHRKTLQFSYKAIYKCYKSIK